ncbi:hypothetical protein [Burkholderia ubonensis]|uniref:hypothetical protein n=1 Tax=Burkholderia ubonensis TaxID=101571 RepID=UPI000F57E0E0|nr:hypothetical protein [Burkholderia ubonensis]
MLWKIEGTAEDLGRFGNLEPEDVLYELDGPKIFTVKLGDKLHLVYESCVDLDTKTVRFLVAPTSSLLLDDLTSGARSVLEVLDQAWVWVIDQGFDGENLSCHVLNNGLVSVPNGFKPEKDIMLWPHLMPLLAVRLIGPDIRRGNVPASVIKRAADAVPAALKKCFERRNRDVTKHGRPDDSRRSFYDLPAQRFAFNSFEIAFHEGLPFTQSRLNLTDDAFGYETDGSELRRALEWAKGDTDSNPDVVMAEAVEKLVPPMHGVVESVEVKGRMLQSMEPIVLNRCATKRVKRFLAAQRADERVLVSFEGFVDELDKGKLSFILRGTTDGGDVVFTFSEEFYDDILEAFNSNARVAVSGKRTLARQPIEVIGFERIAGQSSELEAD